MPDRMPGNMSDKILKDISNRMPEGMPNKSQITYKINHYKIYQLKF